MKMSKSTQMNRDMNHRKESNPWALHMKCPASKPSNMLSSIWRSIGFRV